MLADSYQAQFDFALLYVFKNICMHLHPPLHLVHIFIFLPS